MSTSTLHLHKVGNNLEGETSSHSILDEENLATDMDFSSMLIAIDKLLRDPDTHSRGESGISSR